MFFAGGQWCISFFWFLLSIGPGEGKLSRVFQEASAFVVMIIPNPQMPATLWLPTAAV